jgi:hypothetical protein
MVEAFVGLGEESPGPVEGIVFAAPVSQSLVLHPASALVELGVGQAYEVERIGHLDGLGEGVVEGLAVGPREVEYAVADPLSPGLRAGLDPGPRSGGPAAGDDVEELGVARADVDDGGAPLLGSPSPPATEQGLVESQGADLPDPAGVAVDEGAAVGDHRVVDRVPVAAQLPGHLGHRAAQAPDLLGHPSSRPIGHRPPRRTNPAVLAGERSGGAVFVGAEEAVLVPDEACWASEAR